MKCGLVETYTEMFERILLHQKIIAENVRSGSILILELLFTF